MTHAETSYVRLYSTQNIIYYNSYVTIRSVPVLLETVDKYQINNF